MYSPNNRRHLDEIHCHGRFSFASAVQALPGPRGGYYLAVAGYIQPGGEPVGAAGGLRQAVAGGAAQGEVDGRFKADAMADRDKHGADAGAGAQHGADGFFPVIQRDPRTLVGREFVVGADDQARLCLVALGSDLGNLLILI